MDVIHFTSGATDPLQAFDAFGASFLPLAEGEGNSHISCLHLEIGGKIETPSITHAAALLVVHGRITVETPTPLIRIDIHAGMGAILDKDEAYSLKSEEGAIVLVIESDHLQPSERAISTPQRIAGATWPADSVNA
jgi:redox-sensitive bicupin YhaK (pirin superfamily)